MANRLKALLTRILAAYPYLISCLIIVLVFLITRSSIYLFFPYPDHEPDTETYLMVVRQIDQGQWPNFFMRTPGYPLLIKAALLLTGNMMGVVLAQSLLFLFAAFVLTYSFYVLNRWLALGAAAGLAFFCFCNITLLQEVMLYSDSMYASFLMLSFAGIILSLCRKKNIYFFATSLLMAFTILIRPAAVFLLATLGLLLLYMFVNRFPWKSRLLVTLPVVVILFSLCLYNTFRLGVFALSPYDGFVRLGPTFAFFEESGEYPDFINQEIRKSRANITEEDRRYFQQSWDLRRLRDLYDKYWSPCRYGAFRTGIDDYLPNRAYYKKIGNDAILKHPALYFKFFWTMMYSYFVMNPTGDSQLFLRAHYARELDAVKLSQASPLYREFYHPFSFEGFRKAFPSFVPLPYPFHIEAYMYMFPLIRNILWPIFGLLVLVGSTIRVIRTRARELESFVPFLFCISALGAGVVVSMAEVTVLRYSYVFDFVYYLCPVFALLLLSRRFTEKLRPAAADALSRFDRREKVSLLVSALFCLVLAIGFWCSTVLKYPKMLVSPSLSRLASAITDRNPNDFMSLGVNLMKAGRTDHAIDAFGEVFKRSQDPSAALLQLGIAYRVKGDWATALFYTDQSLQANPKNPYAYFVEGQILLERGRRQDAIEVYRKARRIDPGFHPKNYQQMDPDSIRTWDEILNAP
jgi:hypothetical protein